MELISFIEERQHEILNDALRALHDARLSSYQRMGETAAAECMQKLLVQMLESLRHKELISFSRYSETVAMERLAFGHKFYEVHTAFNILEDVIWQQITRALPPERHAEYLARLSSVMGSGKETLSCTYINAGRRPSRNLQALWQGTDGV